MQYYNDFDYSGNYYDGYSESEEERKRREQELANTAIQTQEVKTYADGTVERTTKEEMPGQFAPAVQPVAVQPVQQQPVQQPVAPVRPDTYQRMIQAESGGRDFDAQGRPLTSPKGAMFAAQVMPATARDPGFGVRPAQAQTPEEFNRVGQDYYNAMLKKYGGNEQAAAAAYNAGPGRVDRNMQANGGMLNVSQLPQETQQYLAKVQPATAVRPGPAPAPAPAAAPAPAVATSTVGIEAYQTAQDDPIKLLQLRNDANAPEFIRKRAGERAYELMNKEVQQATSQKQAQELIQAAGQGDRRASNTIAKELQNQKGSYLKMILLSAISPELAGEEAVKLGYGNRWQTTTDADGKTALVEFNAKGMPLKGFTGDGKEIATDELVQYAAGRGKKQDYDIVGGTFVSDTMKDKDGRPLVGSVYRSKTNPNDSFVQTAEGRKPLTGFRPQSSAGSLSDMYARRQQELLQKLAMVGPEKVAAIVAEDEAVNGPLDARTKEAILQRSTQAAPNMGAIPGAPTGQAQGGQVTAVPPTAMPPQGAAPAPAPAPAAAAGGAPATTGGTIADRRRAAAAASTQATTEAKEAGEDIGTVRANIGKAQANADYLITKMNQLVDHKGFETSVGAQGASYLFGLRDKPIPSALGGADARDWQTRAREVLGQSFLQAIENLRGMGALSNAEGAAATTAIQRLGYIDPVTQLPVITAGSEEEFRAAVTDFQNVIKRSIDRNLVKLGRESKYGTKPESEIAAEQQDKSKPAKEMTPAERAKAELERRRKEKQ